MHTRNTLTTAAAPLPSPIPTGTGSRSAANEIFTEFLENSLQVPSLSLPESQFKSTTRHPIPANIDFRSLAGRARDSVDRLLRSAKEYGAFRIVGHGISSEELRLLVEEAESVFQISEGNLNLVESNGNREEIVWAPSMHERLESAGKLIGTEKYRNFSQNMENLASKLDNVAKQLIEIFTENAGKQYQKGIHEKETVMTLYRYDQNDLLMEQILSLPNENNGKSCGHALSLHIPIDHSQFHVQSKHGPLSFEEGPDTIVVTVGKQLEEWTLGEFKSVYGEMIIVPECQGIRASYSVELKYSPSSTNHNFDKNSKAISIIDQFGFHDWEGCGFEL
uniref:Non-haem dioxygenase N-terminal domain-containing protein n=1 Tax=Fagus sylvatica TaxID=28930 RepID=A0A2N9HKD1_FAGSY